MNNILLLVIFIVYTFYFVTSEKCVDNEPVIENCKKYYKCNQNGGKQEFVCPSNLYYNCLSERCENSFSPACCKNDPIIMEHTAKILGQNCKIINVTIKAPYTCGKYYVCINHEYVEKQCDNNKEFDNILGKCTDKNCGNSQNVVMGPKEIIFVPMQPDDNIFGNDDSNDSNENLWIPIDENNPSESSESTTESIETSTDTGVTTSLEDTTSENSTTDTTSENSTTDTTSENSTTDTTSENSTTDTTEENSTTDTTEENSTTVEGSDTTSTSSDSSDTTTNESTDSDSTDITSSETPSNGTESPTPPTEAPDIIDQINSFLLRVVNSLKYVTNLFDTITSGVNILTDVLGYKEVEDMEVTNSTSGDVTMSVTNSDETTTDGVHSEESIDDTTTEGVNSEETLDDDETFRDSTYNGFATEVNVKPGTDSLINVSLTGKSKDSSKLVIKKAKNVVILVD